MPFRIDGVQQYAIATICENVRFEFTFEVDWNTLACTPTDVTWDDGVSLGGRDLNFAELGVPWSGSPNECVGWIGFQVVRFIKLRDAHQRIPADWPAHPITSQLEVASYDSQP